MRHLTIGVLFGLLAAVAQAQPVTLPRAAEPMVLTDFAKPAGLDNWRGLKFTAATLEGQAAAQFTFPKYEQGENEWPAAYLAYAEGKGYPAKDWSHYGKIVLQVRSSSDKPSDLALELRDSENRNGWAQHFTLAPGKTNRLEVVLHDIRQQVQLSNVSEIVLFTTRPAAAYTITMADLRLEPGDKAPLATLDLAYPNYRGLIFPAADRVTVEVQISPDEYAVRPEQLTAELTCRGGGKSVSVKRALRGRRATMALPTAGLPQGQVELTATVAGPGQPPLSRQWALRKINAGVVRKLKVYIDENNNTIVDGKPFFPLGWYGNGQVSQMREIADSPFNCLLDYGTVSKPLDQMRAYLDEMHKRGLKLIFCANDIYPSANYYKDKTLFGATGNEAITEAVIKAYRDHPALLAWYLNDERPASMVPELEGYYQKFRSLDPNHPAYIVLCNMTELRYFTNTTDVMGVDPYPIPTLPVTRVADWMEAANDATQNHMPTWLVPQAFAWYQHHPPGSDRARIPTPAELLTGCAPTYEESRCMTYLALAHGAKGLVYWCYYNMRMLPQYKQMWEDHKRIGAEVKELSPVLLSPADRGEARFAPSSAPLHTKIKRCQGREYLIAVNGGAEPCQVTFDLRRNLPATVKVMFEDREVPTTGNTLAAQFKPQEVHVYDLGPIAKPRGN